MARGLVSQQSLIDTANAIRFSTENSAKMLPSEMPDNIKSIEGKIVALPKGRVNFYDYDGELLYSYSPKEFIEKGLPNNPRHEGLIAQGWNWDYEEIANQIKEVGGDINVGQMYITQSGATQIQIELDQDNLAPYLRFETSSANTSYIIDWGDNSELIEQTQNSKIYFNQQHIYSQSGKYTIKIQVLQGWIWLMDKLIWDNISNNNFYQKHVINIRLGNNVNMNEDYFDCKNYFSLQTFIIPKTIKHENISFHGCFQNCYSLKIIIIPNINIINFMAQDFLNCYNLQYIILPYNIIYYNYYPVIENCYNLKSITLTPQNKRIEYEENFLNCYSLNKITLPRSTPLNKNSIFKNCYNILEYHVKDETPPTLGTNVFTGINQNCKIYVPYSTDHSVLNAYKTATNWSNWADYIVEEDAPVDYTMPTPIADRPELFVDVEEAEDGDEVNYDIIINIIDQEDE